MAKKQENFTLLGGSIVMAQSLYNPTSDAVWLAAFAPKGAKTVLDVGVGTGGVSLCLLHHEPDAQITGIDISEEMLEACKKNAELNNKNIKLLNEDIFKWSTPEVFDLVITNPPFFFGTPAEHNAHHNVDIERWVKRSVARVKPNGYFCTIIDPFVMSKVMPILYNKHMGEVQILPLFSKQCYAERVLIRARKASKSGTTLFKGAAMNNEQILRRGLTVGAMLAAQDVL